jgi:transposase
MRLKNRVSSTEKETQKRESIVLERCATGMAYQMTLVRQAFYERKDAAEDRKLFCNWCVRVHAMSGQTGQIIEPMAQAARMVEGHLEGNLARWTRGLTTAFIEGLISLFLTVKRKARGYRPLE